MNSLSILIEEPSFLVVNKPAGLFTQAAPGIESVETELISLLRSRLDAPLHPFVGLPHRLDRGTSGALLIARNQRALKRFGEQFQSRKICKIYIALVEGIVAETSGTWSDWMRKIPDLPKAEIVSRDDSEAKEARLQFQVLAKGDRQSLLRIALETGRMHQIRLQAASRQYPVVGDWTYGSSRDWGERSKLGHRVELALHAAIIEFRHPQNGKPTVVRAPFPSTWNQLPHEWLRIANEIAVR